MANVTQVESAQALCDLLAKSRLLTDEQVAQARRLCNESTPARALARRLMQDKWLTTFQAVQLLAGRHVLHMGKYVLRDVIAEGELGRIFAAQHSKLDRQVAIKVLSSRHFQQAETIDRFLAEARRAAALDHPNLIHVFDVDQEGERYYVVMEFVQGRNLQTIVDTDGPLAFERAAEYIRQAALGLAYAHNKGVIHQDISPANLMVDEQGVVKVLNLGIGGLALASRKTADNERTKTPRFSPPESAGVADVRADVYALGATLFYLITGQPPSAGSAPHQPVRDILELRPDTPTPLAKICTKMMLPDPADRFQSVEPIEGILARWLVDYSQRPTAATNTVAAAVQAAVEARTFDPAEVHIERQRRVRKGDLPPPKPRSSSLGLMLSVVSAGLLVLCLVVAVVVFVFRPSRQTNDLETQSGSATSDPVASLDTVRVSAAPDSLETDPDASALPRTTTSGLAVATTPGSQGAKSEPATAAPVGGQQPSGAASSPTATTISTSTGTPTPTPQPEKTTPPDMSGAPVLASQSTEASVNSPAPTATNSSPPTPASPTPASPTPVDPAPVGPTPSGSSGEPTGSEPATASTDWLAKLPPSVALPPLSKVAEEVASQPPLVLGETQMGSPVSVELLGGDKATRNQQFTIQSVKEPAGWRIHLGKQKAAEPGALVAMLSMHENRLQFQWQPEAAAETGAASLCNCVLRLTAGPVSREIVLRQPVEVEPLVMNFEKAPKQEWPLVSPPGDQDLRLSIELGPMFPAHTFEPPPPIPAKKGITHILFRGENALIWPELDVTVAIRNKLQIALNANLKRTDVPKPVRWTLGAVKKAQAGLASELQNLEQQLPILQNRQAQLTDPAGKQEIGLKISQTEERKVVVAREIEQLAAAATLYDQTHEKGLIHFRVFFLVGTTEVEVLRTKAPAE